MKHNISIPLDKVAAYLEAFANPDKVAPEKQARIALELHKSMEYAMKKLKDGHVDQNLTVCSGRLGYVDPKDAQRLMSGEIPRITVYRAKKDNHNMRLYLKHTPKFYQGNKKCKTAKPSTPSSTIKHTTKRAPRKTSSTAKP